MYSPLRDDFGPEIVPPGHLFVLGDNRGNSMDSRFWGFLGAEQGQRKGKDPLLVLGPYHKARALGENRPDSSGKEIGRRERTGENCQISQHFSFTDR